MAYSGNVNDENTYNSNFNLSDPSITKPTWAELEKVFNEKIADGFGGEIDKESIVFNKENWHKTQEVRINYESVEDIPREIPIFFENTSVSEESKKINLGDMAVPNSSDDYPIHLNTWTENHISIMNINQLMNTKMMELLI